MIHDNIKLDTESYRSVTDLFGSVHKQENHSITNHMKYNEHSTTSYKSCIVQARTSGSGSEQSILCKSNTINANENQSLNKYKKLYNVYSALFDNNICLLYNCIKTGMYSIFINANKIYKILNTDLTLLYTQDLNNKYIYTTSFKTSQLAKNIHILLKNNYSVILINPQYNVIAVHHPVNKYNTYFIPF